MTLKLIDSMVLDFTAIFKGFRKPDDKGYQTEQNTKPNTIII